jgi:nitrous oxidase accessory protein
MPLRIYILAFFLAWILLASPTRAGTLSVPLGASDGTANLVRALESAADGDVLILAKGVHPGPLRIARSVILQGEGAIIDGGGRKTPVVISAPGVRIENIKIRNSGNDISGPDACVYIEPHATGSVLKGNRLEECAFGIWVHETRGVHLIDNQIRGRKNVRPTDRGNGIHLFDAEDLIVRGNTVIDARDGIYVSATEKSVIESNSTNGVRFGIHYMYSYHNTIRNNQANRNKVGIALMESRNLKVDGNQASDNHRNGILFRDVQFSDIRNNHLEGNGNGMFFFSSTDNVIVDNAIIDNEIGLKVWAGTRRNRIEGNLIRGNREQVFFVGAEDQAWGKDGRGNRWGDYLGWDQDADGIGDRPHRADSFTAALLFRFPSSALLLRSPALEMLSHLAERLPILRTPTVVDHAPIVGEGPG